MLSPWVLAHPEPASFNHAMTEAAVAEIRRARHELEVSHLVAEGFGAVAGRDDFR